MSLSPDISIVVPTLREAENIPVLTRRLAEALSGRSWELVIVDDDSNDGTESVCAELARTNPVKLVIRRPPKDGLSGAVLEGFKHAQGSVLVVMDADLQHPPEKVPDMVGALAAGDFALGSRYTQGGKVVGNWSAFRALNSWVATVLARPFAGKISDPMSGFFALKRSTLDGAERLTPLGYKIALELMCKCRVKRVVEVPITFGQRERGLSKLSAREQFRYLEHLSRLYDYTFPRFSPVVKFLISVALAWLPAAAVFAATHSILASYPVAIGVTALLHLRYVNAQREFILRPRPWLDFWMIALGEYACAFAVALYLKFRAPGLTAVERFLLPFLVATVVRYVLRKEFLHDIRGLRRDPRVFD